MSIEDYATYIKGLTGYTLAEDDKALLSYIDMAERQHILNDTAQTTFPAELEYICRDCVTGRFLLTRKDAIIGSDSLQVVKSISEGDVSVSLAGSSDEDRLNALIHALTMKEVDLSCFRKFRW